MKQYLDKHIRSHTGEKLFTCIECNKSFSQKSYLNTHIRIIHNGERTFKCDLCEKTFARKNTLEAHYASHSTDKPYQCKFCDKSFKSASYLAKHNKIHFSREKFECRKCKKIFSDGRYFKKHEKEVCGLSSPTHNSDSGYLHTAGEFVDCGGNIKQEMLECNVNHGEFDSKPVVVDERFIKGEVLETDKNDNEIDFNQELPILNDEMVIKEELLESDTENEAIDIKQEIVDESDLFDLKNGMTDFLCTSQDEELNVKEELENDELYLDSIS